MPNGAIKQCTNPACNREFNRKERKHHCRCCGNVYCIECTQCILPLNPITAMVRSTYGPIRLTTLRYKLPHLTPTASFPPCPQRAVEGGYPLGRFLHNGSSDSLVSVADGDDNDGDGDGDNDEVDNEEEDDGDNGRHRRHYVDDNDDRYTRYNNHRDDYGGAISDEDNAEDFASDRRHEAMPTRANRILGNPEGADVSRARNDHLCDDGSSRSWSCENWRSSGDRDVLGSSRNGGNKIYGSSREQQTRDVSPSEISGSRPGAMVFDKCRSLDHRDKVAARVYTRFSGRSERSSCGRSGRDLSPRGGMDSAHSGYGAHSATSAHSASSAHSAHSAYSARENLQMKESGSEVYRKTNTRGTGCNGDDRLENRYSSDNPLNVTYNRSRTLDVSDRSAAAASARRPPSSSRPISLLASSLLANSSHSSHSSHSSLSASSGGDSVAKSWNEAAGGGGGFGAEFGKSRTLDSSDKDAIRRTYGAANRATGAAAAIAAAAATAAAASTASGVPVPPTGKARRQVASAYRHLSMDLTDRFGDLSSLLVEPSDPNHLSLLSTGGGPGASGGYERHESSLRAAAAGTSPPLGLSAASSASAAGAGGAAGVAGARSGLGLPPRKDPKARGWQQQQQQQQQEYQHQQQQTHQQEQHVFSQQRPQQASPAALQRHHSMHPLLAPGASPLTPSGLRPPPPLTPSPAPRRHARSNSSSNIHISISLPPLTAPDSSQRPAADSAAASGAPLRSSRSFHYQQAEAAAAEAGTDVGTEAAEIEAAAAAAEAAAERAEAAAATAAAAAQREALYKALAAPSMVKSPSSHARAAREGSVNLAELLTSWENGVSFLDPDVSLRTPRDRKGISSPKISANESLSDEEKEGEGCFGGSTEPVAEAGGSVGLGLKPARLQRAAEAKADEWSEARQGMGGKAGDGERRMGGMDVAEKDAVQSGGSTSGRGSGSNSGSNSGSGCSSSSGKSTWARRRPNLRVHCGSSGNFAASLPNSTSALDAPPPLPQPAPAAPFPQPAAGSAPTSATRDLGAGAGASAAGAAGSRVTAATRAASGGGGAAASASASAGRLQECSAVWSGPVSLIEWSTSDVCSWLIHSVGFPDGSGREYARDFDQHQVDGLSLVGITNSHPALAHMRLADYTLFEFHRRQLVTAEAAAPPAAHHPPPPLSTVDFSSASTSSAVDSAAAAGGGSAVLCGSAVNGRVGVGAVRCGSDPTVLLHHLPKQHSVKSRHYDASSTANTPSALSCSHPFRHRRTSSIGASIVSDLLQKRTNTTGGAGEGRPAAVQSPAARISRQGSGVAGAVGGWFAGWGSRQEGQQESEEERERARDLEEKEERRRRSKGEEEEGEEGEEGEEEGEGDEEGEVVAAVVEEVVCLRGEVTAAEERECTVKAQ
ncbi:unnamed protein product [Closterium sp. NIES-53]